MSTNTNCNPDFLNERYIINKQIGEGSEGNIFLPLIQMITMIICIIKYIWYFFSFYFKFKQESH